MRKIESSEKISNQDQEVTNTTLPDDATSISGLEIESQSQAAAPEKRARYQNIMIIGVLTLIATIVVLIGVFNLNHSSV
jgi:hypothetical protein